MRKGKRRERDETEEEGRDGDGNIIKGLKGERYEIWSRREKGR